MTDEARKPAPSDEADSALQADPEFELPDDIPEDAVRIPEDEA